jgi:hypothetical protein
MAKGLFITFEGIDGSGKTTVAKRVVEALKQKGYNAIYTCEPTGSELGNTLKSGYEKEVNPFMELFLFLADRAAHTKDIVKWMDEGKIGSAQGRRNRAPGMAQEDKRAFHSPAGLNAPFSDRAIRGAPAYQEEGN